MDLAHDTIDAGLKVEAGLKKLIKSPTRDVLNEVVWLLEDLLVAIHSAQSDWHLFCVPAPAYTKVSYAMAENAAFTAKSFIETMLEIPADYWDDHRLATDMLSDLAEDFGETYRSRAKLLASSRK